MEKGNTSFKPLKENVLQLPSGTPFSVTGKVYSLLREPDAALTVRRSAAPETAHPGQVPQ